MYKIYSQDGVITSRSPDNPGFGYAKSLHPNDVSGANEELILNLLKIKPGDTNIIISRDTL